MPILIRMTSPIGNKAVARRLHSSLYSSRAFTFIEIMITLSILSAGIVMIYRSFFMCLNAVQHLSNRWEAYQFIEEKFETLEQQLREQGDTSFIRGNFSDWGEVAGQKLRFDYTLNVNLITNAPGAYIAEIDLSWKERNRTITLHRQAALSQFQGS